MVPNISSGTMLFIFYVLSRCKMTAHIVLWLGMHIAEIWNFAHHLF